MAIADDIQTARERQKIEAWDAAERRMATEHGCSMPAGPLPAELRAGLDSWNKWTATKGVRSLPAKPFVVANFCLDAHSMGSPWATIAKTLKAISAAHDHHHLADPCSSSIVRKTVERIAPQVDPPRGWDKDEKEEWALLPASVRAAITRRENDRDKELRRLQNKAATNGAATKSVESKIKDIENDCTAKRI